MTGPQPSQRLPSNTGNAELDYFFDTIMTRDGMTMASLSEASGMSTDLLRRIKNYGANVSIVRLEHMFNSVGYRLKLRPNGKPRLQRPVSGAGHPELAKLLTELVSPGMAKMLADRAGVYSGQVYDYYSGAVTPGFHSAEELANAAGYYFVVEKIDAQQG